VTLVNLEWLGYTCEQVGKIDINEFATYVAVDRKIAHDVVIRLNSGKIKGANGEGALAQGLRGCRRRGTSDDNGSFRASHGPFMFRWDQRPMMVLAAHRVRRSRPRLERAGKTGPVMTARQGWPL
jgi:hypothetical protein